MPCWFMPEVRTRRPPQMRTMISSRHAALPASMPFSTDTTRYFAVAPPEVVLSETGAGGLTFTKVPGGAMVSMGRNSPWLRGKS